MGGMSAEGWLTLIGIISAFALPFAAWMTNVSSNLKLIKQQSESQSRELQQIREGRHDDVSKLWQAHTEDVRELSKLSTLVAALSTEVANLKQHRGNNRAG